MDTVTLPDPIDQLVPPPRPWWTRLVVGVAIVGTVGVLSALFGLGYLYPRPECCGSGSGSSTLSLTPDGNAVTATTYFYNSSGRKLEILSATADLPGARVINISLVNDNRAYFPPQHLDRLPAIVSGTSGSRVAITFVPRTCDDRRDTWGTLDLDLDVVNGWLPSITRTYTLPDPVARADQLAVFPPTDEPNSPATLPPLAAACALLDGGPD